MRASSRNLFADLRVICLVLICAFSLAELGISAAVLHYTLLHSRGYLPSNPAVLIASALTLVCSTCSLWFLRNTAWTRVRFEIPQLAICWAVFLGSMIAFSHATPGLMFHCGKYEICTGLQASFALGILALAALTFAVLGLLFAVLSGRRFYPDIWSSRVESWRYVAGPDALALPSPASGNFSVKDPFADQLV